jgi:hypothetical protein
VNARVRRVGVALLAAAALAAPAAGATVDDRAATPLERAAFAALPAVYELRVRVPVTALLDGTRRIPAGRSVELRGTAFGVAAGRVVTARHLLRPSNGRLVEEALAQGPLPGIPDDRTLLRAQAGTPSITLLPAATPTDPAPVAGPPIRAREVESSDRVGDLALLAIPDATAPTLRLDDRLSVGIPVVAVGFGDRPDTVPAIRTGTLDGPRRIEDTDDTRFGGLVADVRRGDSGGPVLDEDGRAHGVVLRRGTNEATAVVARADAIRALLRPLRPDGPNAATRAFRDGMEEFWGRDYPAAARRLAALAATNDGALVRHEAERAAAVARARWVLDDPRAPAHAAVAIGMSAVVLAIVWGLARVRRRPYLTG